MTDEEDTTPDVEDKEISFFLQLLYNDYQPDDVARVAADLAQLYEEQFECLDCEENVVEKEEFFLVHEELEKQVELESGRLCVRCFERRLGRQLSYFDFTHAMLYESSLPASPLLKHRLINGLEESLGKEQ